LLRFRVVGFLFYLTCGRDNRIGFACVIFPDFHPKERGLSRRRKLPSLGYAEFDFDW